MNPGTFKVWESWPWFSRSEIFNGKTALCTGSLASVCASLSVLHMTRMSNLSFIVYYTCRNDGNWYKKNVNIKGIRVGHHSEAVNNMQYADDGVLFFNGEEEIHEAINAANRFWKVAGTLLNVETCEGLWIATYKAR